MKKIIVICVVSVLSILMLIACPTSTPKVTSPNNNINSISAMTKDIWEDDSLADCADVAGIYGNGAKITMLFEPDGNFYSPSFSAIVGATGVVCTSNENDPVTGLDTLTRAQIKTISAPTTPGVDDFTGTYTISGTLAKNTITVTLADNTILMMSYNPASGITVNSKTGADTRIIVGKIFTILDVGY